MALQSDQEQVDLPCYIIIQEVIWRKEDDSTVKQPCTSPDPPLASNASGTKYYCKVDSGANSVKFCKCLITAACDQSRQENIQWNQFIKNGFGRLSLREVGISFISPSIQSSHYYPVGRCEHTFAGFPCYSPSQPHQPNSRVAEY